MTSSGRPSGNPLLDAFLGVVLSDGFRPGKPLLTFSAEGDIFAGLDFITGFLHKPQKIIVVLGCDDKPIDGLLELLLPARAAFGFGVLLVAHALVLRGRDNSCLLYTSPLLTIENQMLRLHRNAFYTRNCTVFELDVRIAVLQPHDGTHRTVSYTHLTALLFCAFSVPPMY